MTKIILEPTEALNDAFKKVNIDEDHFNNFKAQLTMLISLVDNKRREDFHKTHIRDFLKATYYDPNHSINSKGDNDLVIQNGRSANSTVGVIIETKRPGNYVEMPANGQINKKGLRELVLYFLRERITEENNDLKHLVVTNVVEWFIFDAQVFDKVFFQDKALKKKFLDFENKKLSGTTTDFFYTEIAAPAIEKNLDKLTYTHFRLSDYEKFLADESGQNELITLYKVLSPEHLLKLDFVNDSNTLDKRFYSELLHIIGLTEVRKGGKKLIERKKEGQRDSGSLIENTIHQLDTIGKVSRMEGADGEGDSYEDRLFQVGLELCIIWMNRILFLKLLEGQLIKYHNNDKSHSFLSMRQVPRFGELNALFFSVLARKPEDRSEYFREKFAHVPYLNSSLFELSEVEDKNILISNLFNERKLPLYGQTVLRQPTGKRKTGEMNTLEYLFSFLDAYDFASEGKAIIQKAKKSMISASVLGLIFEKINGYKDGSFFTPGFITMYMCRETIRKAVLQKFREVKGWDYDNLRDLHNKIEPGDIEEANEIVNSLKICDPAVGSGHFLVSALNEIIAIKQELGILTDKHGNRLHHYNIKVGNDELAITGHKREVFEYRPGYPESQRVQETLFHEKQTIIENCLFGVDINPNSVRICRLRLWIELLKNAYYKEDTGFTELETLPNIDINIKCGNSLVSRFKIDDNLRQIAKSTKWSIVSYQNAVEAYKRSHEKEDKQELEKLINRIKSNYVQTIQKRNSTLQRLHQLKRDYEYKFPENGFFVNEPEITYGSNADKIENEKQRLIAGIEQLEKDIEAEKRFFETHNAFEWRFEFPEVLNDEGDFVGFDVVIGNPPYILSREKFKKKEKEFFGMNYNTIHEKPNLFLIFIERSLAVLKNKGVLSFIVPNSLTGMESAYKIRELLLNENQIISLINLLGETFKDVGVESCILIVSKHKSEKRIKYASLESGKIVEDRFQLIKPDAWKQNRYYFFDITSSEEELMIISKIRARSDLLANYYDVKVGLQAYERSKGKPKQTQEDVENHIFDYDYKYDKTTYPYLKGSDVGRYSLNWSGKWLRYGEWLSQPKSFTQFSLPRILIREITGQFPHVLKAMYVSDTFLNNKSIINVLQKDDNLSLLSLLGFLNSKLISFYHRRQTVKGNRIMFPKIIIKDLQSYPFPKNKEHLRDIEHLVKKNLSPKDKNTNKQELENQIDQLVYQLYDLTDEEIQIIENS